MPQSLTRLLVVGGSGFIGRHIVDHAIGLGWDVTSLSLTSRPGSEEIFPGVRYVAVDFVNGETLKKVLGEVFLSTWSTVAGISIIGRLETEAGRSLTLIVRACSIWLKP